MTVTKGWESTLGDLVVQVGRDVNRLILDIGLASFSIGGWKVRPAEYGRLLERDTYE